MRSQEGDTHYEVTLGPIKIKDGLFMGDELAAKDIEFIISNKVTHIVNTVSQNIPNLWEKFGVHYLSVGWTQKETNVFDPANEAVQTIFAFVEQAMERGESCLVHSINGKSRASMVVVAYLIYKYQWTLAKCLQYLDSRKQRFEIRANYLHQLEDLQHRMKMAFELNDSWRVHHTKQELIINNTFKNSLNFHEEYYEVPDFYLVHANKKNKINRRVTWGESDVLEQNKLQQTVKSTSTDLKPILKQISLQAYNHLHFKRTNSTEHERNTSDSLDKLLFEESRKNIYELSISTERDNHQEKIKASDRSSEDNCQGHYFRSNLPKFSRKTTINNGTRPKSLDEKDFQCEKEKDSQKYFSIKKTKHYEQVMASYQSLKAPTKTEKLHKPKKKQKMMSSVYSFERKQKMKTESLASPLSNLPKRVSKSTSNLHKAVSPPTKIKRTSFKTKLKVQLTVSK